MKFFFYFLLISSNLLIAQQGQVLYTVNPIPLGATTFTVSVDVNITEPPEGPAGGGAELTLQIIDRASVDDLTAPGEDITSFSLLFGTGFYNFNETVNLPVGINFQENLPDDKVYRLINPSPLVTIPIFDDITFDQTGFVELINSVIFDSTPTLELTIGGSSQPSNIDLSFIDRLTTVEDTNDFIIKTNVEANISEFDFASIKFQIHIVDEANIFEMDDVTPQELISESMFIGIPDGNSNIDFILAAPDILSENLPNGKAYRVRLVNEEFNSENAFPFPYKLTVIAQGTLSIPEIIDEKQLISVYPNPSDDFIVVNGLTNVDSYKIFDISGAFVKEIRVSDQLIISDLTSGVYFLTLKDNTLISRFVKK